MENKINVMVGDIKIHCKYDVLMPVEQLKVHPLNPNKHSPEQITRLVKLYNGHGVRHPIIVSKRSEMIVAGHGRLQAAIEASMGKFPVVFQDFESNDAEYLFMISDNAIQQDWAILDLGMINTQIGDIGPIDIDLLGMKDFKIDCSEFEPGTLDEQGKLDELKMIYMECPHCGKQFEKRQARIIEN